MINFKRFTKIHCIREVLSIDIKKHARKKEATDIKVGAYVRNGMSTASLKFNHFYSD